MSIVVLPTRTLMDHRSPRPARPGPPAVAPAACVIIAMLAAVPAAGATDDEAARALLRKSWEQACGRYDETTNWTARQACNLAWFRANEKGVWEHNLNPHGPAAGGPSS